LLSGVFFILLNAGVGIKKRFVAFKGSSAVSPGLYVSVPLVFVKTSLS